MRRVLNILFILLALAGTAEASRSRVKLSDTLIYQRDSLFIESIRLKNQNFQDSAVIALQKADSIDPSNAAICYELGMRLIKTDFDNAYSYLKRASELSPDNYYYQKKVIAADLYKGDTKTAIAGYEKLLKRYPDHEGDLFDLAVLYGKTGDYKRAIKTYDRLEKLTGTDRYVSLSKVGVYLESKDYKSAIKTLDRLIVEMPLDASLWAYKGDIYMELREMETAFECYQKSMELNPNCGYTIESLYGYYIRSGELDKADEYLLKIFASDEIQFQTKQRYMTQAIKYYSASQRQMQGLEPYYKAMIESDSENSEARLMYARYLTSQKRDDEAIEELRSAVYVNPQCKDCWEFLLFQVAQSSDTTVVEKTLADALDAIPESADFYFYSGLWNYGKGMDDEAFAFMLKADSIVDASGGKALSIENRKDLWNYLFNAYYYRGDTDRYYFYLDKLLNAFPDDLMGLNNYAYMLAVDNGDIERAEQMSKKTIDSDPLNSVYLDTYAYILMKKGKLTYAKFYSEQALEYMKDKPDAVIVEHYGDILFKLGDVDGALEYWQKAYDMERDGQDKETLKQKITTKQYVEEKHN